MKPVIRIRWVDEKEQYYEQVAMQEEGLNSRKLVGKLVGKLVRKLVRKLASRN